MTFFAISHLRFASRTPPTITRGNASCPSVQGIVTQTDEEDRKSSVIKLLKAMIGTDLKGKN